MQSKIRLSVNTDWRKLSKSAILEEFWANLQIFFLKFVARRQDDGSQVVKCVIL